MQVMEFEIWRKRHAVLLREAEEERLARRLRKNGRRRGTCGFSKRVRAWVGLVFASQRPAGEGTAGIEVRWPMPEDEEKISELLELNGAPRAMAVGEGFIVAEKDGEVLAAMSCSGPAASPDHTEARANRATPAEKTRRRPKRSPRLPPTRTREASSSV